MEAKIQCIKDNKDSAIAALNAYLDSIYNLTDTYYDKSMDENGNITQTLKPELVPDTKAEEFILELAKDAKEYESVRAKLISEDFNLSLAEIARVGLAYVYIGLTFEKQLAAIKEAQKKTMDIIEILNSPKDET